MLHFERFFNVYAYKMKVHEFGVVVLRLDAIIEKWFFFCRCFVLNTEQNVIESAYFVTF